MFSLDWEQSANIERLLDYLLISTKADCESLEGIRAECVCVFSILHVCDSKLHSACGRGSGCRCLPIQPVIVCGVRSRHNHLSLLSAERSGWIKHSCALQDGLINEGQAGAEMWGSPEESLFRSVIQPGCVCQVVLILQACAKVHFIAWKGTKEAATPDGDSSDDWTNPVCCSHLTPALHSPPSLHFL